MWEGCYGKESFDLRLTVLRMLRQLKWIAGATLAGILIFGGGYCIRELLLAEKLYCAESTYHVSYDVKEEKDVGTVYINETTWNTYMASEVFLDAVQERCETGMTNAELAETLSATLASDLRMPSTRVTCREPERALTIAQAAETVMTEVMPTVAREILTVTVLDSAADAAPVDNDVRAGRAVALSAVLSCFFAVVLLLLKELGEDAVWLPATLERRYGLKTVGTTEGVALQENLSYLFSEKDRVAVCPINGELNPIQLLETLKVKCPATVSEGWFAAPAPLLAPETCQTLRGAQGILLAVPAGRYACRQLEDALELLGQQDCKITAVILCDADEWLLRHYYHRRKGVLS